MKSQENQRIETDALNDLFVGEKETNLDLRGTSRAVRKYSR
jgi:hypothetical protein